MIESTFVISVLSTAAFKIIGHLKKHKMVVHENIRKYKCNECSRAFSEKANLKVHIASIHQNLRNFKCNQCDSAFSSKSNLISHNKGVHSDKRNHICKICEKAFKTSSSLIKHRKTHIKITNTDFKCNQCGKKFLNEDYLQMHITTTHT